MLDSSRTQIPTDIEEQPLDPLYFLGILKKRKFYGLFPFVGVFAIGFAAAMLWPPTFLSEGKILVESQQIPVDLVRPTVTATATERIATLQQRVMTRDNLLNIVDKYQLFTDQRDRLSRTELLDVMRANTVIKPVELDSLRPQNANFTVAFTVGFMDRRPDVATSVANELLTLFLDLDARNRTNRATETTKFLAQEVEKLKVELAAIDARILQSYHQPQETTRETTLPELMNLKAELAAKSAIYSDSHPDVKRLKAQIAALEKVTIPVTTQAATLNNSTNTMLDPLLLQRLSVQQNLANTSEKLASAQRGENLERDQFSERLQIIEQATPPQKPIKPNRPKIIALAFVGALAAGFAGIWMIESIDKTIRSNYDLLAVANGQPIIAIPYIATKAELSKKKNRMVTILGILLAISLGTMAAVHLFMRPLDELWGAFTSRLF
jgi:uncharacterized protein involved in exopolysaccharide biosynthesis